jgi:hypothetical protein
LFFITSDLVVGVQFEAVAGCIHGSRDVMMLMFGWLRASQAPSAPEEEAVEGEAEPGQQPDAEHMQEQGSEQGQGEGEGEGEGGKENV